MLSGVSYYSSSTVTIPLTVTAPNYVVTTTADDAGAPSNCTSAGNGCSLRDALAAATAAGGANISFDSTVFARGANDYADQRHAEHPVEHDDHGATTGSGATLNNLVTVGGNSDVQVFSVAAGVTGAAIDNLIIGNGALCSGSGGGLGSSGTVTVTGSTFPPTPPMGGGIDNTGTLTLKAAPSSQTTRKIAAAAYRIRAH